MSSVKAIALHAKPRESMQTLERARVSLERGIDGDFRGAQKGRQLTLLSETAWRKACAELQLELPWTTRRANLLVDGIEFSANDVGKTLRIGDVELVITRETDPCSRMDDQHAGLTSALMSDWRGGVCCDVVSAGSIEIGDRVEFD